MKKIHIILFTACLIISSCGAEEETPEPPSNIVQTPDPEPVVETPTTTNEFSVTLIESSGGTIRLDDITEYGTYQIEENTSLELTAIPSEGFYFYTWKELENEYNETIQIQIDSNKTYTPIFLSNSGLNFVTNPVWDLQGYHMDSGDMYVGDDLGSKNLNLLENINSQLKAVINGGSNSVIFDYYLTKCDLIDNQIQNSESYKGIVPLAMMANKLGLTVNIKTNFINYDKYCNNQPPTWFDWGNIEPSNPEIFFQNYTEALLVLAEIIDNSFIENWSITNELRKLTTGEQYTEQWLTLINRLKAVTNVKIGGNFRALKRFYFPIPDLNRGDYSSEIDLVPEEILQALDLLAYPFTQTLSGTMNVII